MPTSEFWLHTSYDPRRPWITLHRTGCEQLRIARVKPHFTGPLTWDQLAALPVESYVPCLKCRPASASRCWQDFTNWRYRKTRTSSARTPTKPTR
jgi:hypothetical protein